MRPRRKVVLSTENQKKLAEQLGTAPNTVRRALRFELDSVLARQIRETALNEYPSKLVINPKD